MFRVLLYFICITLIGAFFAFLANHPGNVVMDIGNQRIALPLFIFIGFALIGLILLLFILWLLRAIFYAPKNIAQHFEEQHNQRGYEALSNGLIAALSGDVKTAINYKRSAVKYLGKKNEPLVKMLEAQTLLLDNDTAKAIMVFEDMSKNPKTRLAGLHGLYREAVKSGAYEAANQYAEQASQVSKTVKWANQAMLNHYSAEGDFDKAISLFDQAEKALPRAERRTKKLNHYRAVLWTGKAMDLFENQPEEARKFALKAQKIDNDFVPTTVVCANILYQLHENRKADKMVEALWRKTPHPDLANIYIKAQEPAHDRLKRAQKLASQNPDYFESNYSVARTAYDAGEFTIARQYVEKAIHIHPRESAYLLCADIEEATSSDQGLVRQWLSLALRAERDPVWMADGASFAEWAAVSPISGKVDAFEWIVPIRQKIDTIEENENFAKNIKLVENVPVAAVEKWDTQGEDKENTIEIVKVENEKPIENEAEEPLEKNEEETALKQKNTQETIETSQDNINNTIKKATKNTKNNRFADEAVPTRINVDDPGVNDE